MTVNATDHTPETASQPRLRLTDTTLRDGSHAVRHRYTPQQVAEVAAALDRANIEVIEVTHGDGLAGSSFNYGFGAHSDVELVSAAAAAVKTAKIAVLMLPGLGTIEDLERARDAGASIARVATHSTEADISVQHFQMARDLGMETVGFLMLSHMNTPEKLAAQARIMADAGCQCVYVVDSAGALLMADVRDRVTALGAELSGDAQVGFHGHQNLSLGVANSVVAFESGARQIDGTLCALGAGPGNSPIEVLAAVFDQMGVPTGVNVDALCEAADETLRAMFPDNLPVIDRNAIIQGRFGVYNSFFLHAARAEQRYGVPAHKILRRVGELNYVGGQEDMIIDVAISLRDELAAQAH